MKARDAMVVAMVLGAGSLLAACNVLTGADTLHGEGAGGAGGDVPVTVVSSGSLAGGGTSTSGGATTASSSSAASGGTTTSSASASSSAASSSSSSGAPPCAWPTGGYGTDMGQTVAPNLAWQGYPAGSAQLGSISIHDYFDCDGSKGVTALLVLQSATWCGVCQDEASGLNGQAQSWMSKGIRVLTLMIEDEDANPATVQTAEAWKSAFGLTAVGVAADPSFSFSPPSGDVGLPMNILIDPRTMKIVDVEEGFSGDYTAVEQLAQKNAH